MHEHLRGGETAREEERRAGPKVTRGMEKGWRRVLRGPERVSELGLSAGERVREREREGG